MRDKLIEIVDHTHRIRPGVDWISEDGKATWIQADSTFARVPVGSLKGGTIVACIVAEHPSVQSFVGSVPSCMLPPFNEIEPKNEWKTKYYTPSVMENALWVVERFSENGGNMWTAEGCSSFLWDHIYDLAAIDDWVEIEVSTFKHLVDRLQQVKQTQPEQVPMAGGKAASSKGPAFHLIPTVALIEIANRFEKGVERKKDKAWNATSNNQECLLDKDFAIERLSHVIHHAMKLRDQLVSGVKPGDESMVDNASAVAWGGVFAICATSAMTTSRTI